MNLTKVHIENFKSIIDISINSPNPFTVFVGPNGSGKSNIFEAIQLATLSERFGSSKGLYKEWINIFGGYESIKPKFDFNNKSLTISIYEDSGDDFHFIDTFGSATRELPSSPIDSNSAFSKSLDKRLSLLKNCSRIFIGREKANKIPSSELLNSDASNLAVGVETSRNWSFRHAVHIRVADH